MAQSRDLEALLESTMGENLFNRKGKLEYAVASVMNLTADYDLRESIFDLPTFDRKAFQKSIENVTGDVAARVSLKGDVVVDAFSETENKIVNQRVRPNLEVAFKAKAVDLYDLSSLPYDPILKKEDRKQKMREILERVITCSGDLQFDNLTPIRCGNLIQGWINEALEEVFSSED